MLGAFPQEVRQASAQTEETGSTDIPVVPATSCPPGEEPCTVPQTPAATGAECPAPTGNFCPAEQPICCGAPGDYYCSDLPENC